MLKNYFQKIVALSTLVVLIATSTLPFTHSAMAQANDPEEESAIEEKLTLARDFFATAIDSENLFTPFDDFFDQNQCKRRDVFALTQKRDSIGSLIRKGILDFDTSVTEIRIYQRQWELTSAELYMARNAELLGTDDSLKLQNDVLKLYPSNPLIGQELSRLVIKYNSRLDEYENCNPSWGLIGRKWEQFKKDLKNSAEKLAAAWNDLGDEVDKTVKSLEDTYDNLVATKNNILAGDFSQFGSIDYGPLSKYLDETNKELNKIGNLTDQVEAELEANQNLTLSELAEKSINLSGSVDANFIKQLEKVNEDLTYGFSDNVVANVWTAMATTPDQIEAFKETVTEANEASLTRQLSLLNARQCREKE